MSVELPAPWTVGRRVAKKTDPVKELAEFLGQLGKLSEMLVEPHCVARCFISACADSGTQHAISQLALPLLEFGEAETVTHQIAVNIAPGSPDLAIDVEPERASLAWVERCQERIGGVDQGLCRCTCFVQ